MTLTILITTPPTARPRVRPLRERRHERTGLPSLHLNPSCQWRSRRRRARASLPRLLTSRLMSPQSRSCLHRAQVSLLQRLTSPRSRSRPHRAQVFSPWRHPFLKTPRCRLLVQATTVCQPLVNRLQGYGEHARGGTSTPRRCHPESESLWYKCFPHTISLLTFVPGIYALLIGVFCTPRAQ